MSVCEEDGDDDPSLLDPHNPVVQALLMLRKRIAITTISTAFSGIDTPGTALEQLRCGIDKHLFGVVSDASTLPFCNHLHATEWSASAQDELKHHPCAPGCLFSNIEEFLSPVLRSQLLSLQSYDKLNSICIPLLFENKNAVKMYKA